MKYEITNASPTKGQDYGVTKYRVTLSSDEVVEFDLNDVLHPKKYDELVERHGEDMRKLLDHIRSMLIDW